MNYQKHYDVLIDQARNRLLEGYTEKHHIMPRCMNGSNNSTNLVALTPEEHYVAHQLLVKIYPNNYKLVYAVQMMTIKSSNHSGRNNKLYGWLRKKNNESRKGKKLKLTKEQKQKKSEKMKDNKNALGCKHSEEVNQKKSERTKGNKVIPCTEERRKNISKAKKGKLWSLARRKAYEDSK